MNNTNSLSQKTPQELIDIILFLEAENKKLSEKLALILAEKHSPKSESSKEPAVFDEPETLDQQALQEIEETEAEITVSGYTRKKKTGREPLPKELPREEILYDLSEAEKRCDCGCQKTCIGEEASEQLEFIPAKVYVIRHIRKKYACQSCEDPKILTAKMPPQPIAKSIAGPGLLAQLLVSKYCYHLPLYRQELILQNAGVEISRATTSAWVIKCAQLLQPIVNLLQDQILNYDVSYADETTVQVLKEVNRNPENKSYIWVFSGGAPEQFSILYRYDPSRAHTIPLEFFGLDYTGYIHCDGYAAYDTMAVKNHSTLVGCLLHARRKFFQITKIVKKRGLAHQAVDFFRKIATHEKNIRELNLKPDDIKLYRIEKVKPILDSFKIWLDAHLPLVPPKFPIGEAIRYTLNQWPKLNNFLKDGRLEWSNNASERWIKPFAVGRKNWLFCNSPAGAHASAIIFSIIQTCQHHQVEPYKYLKNTLKNLPKCQTISDFEALLPYNFKNQ